MSHVLAPLDPNASTRKPQPSSKPPSDELEFPKSHEKDSFLDFSSTSNKRPRLVTDDGTSDSDSIDDDDPRLRYITYDCNQVRRKINTFINNGGMRVGQFQDAIGVSAGAYGRFMKQNGKFKGVGCDTYDKAAVFFMKRELAGVPMPKASASKKAKTSGGKAVESKGAKDDGKKWDVSDITLDDEAEGKVPVYETCDSMRRIIAAHLRRDGITQASLCRELSKCTGVEGKKINASQLAAFQGKHGARAGSKSGVFYSAYVYFEKLRVRDGKPKSAFREEMEELWEFGGSPGSSMQPGFDLEHDSNCTYICHVSARPWEDKYGIIHFD